MSLEEYDDSGNGEPIENDMVLDQGESSIENQGEAESKGTAGQLPSDKPTGETAPPTFSDTLLARAGLSAEAAAAQFDSAESLEQALNASFGRFIGSQGQPPWLQQPQQPAFSPPAFQQPVAQQPPQGGQPGYGPQSQQAPTQEYFQPYDFKGIEGWDDGLSKELSGFQQHVFQQVAPLVDNLQQMQQQLQQVTQAYHQQQKMGFYQDVERIFSQNKDWKNLLGEGSVEDLALGSIPLRNRQQLVQSVELMMQGFHQSGQQVPPLKQLVLNAAYLTFPDYFKKLAETQANEKTHQRLKDSKGRFTSAPSSSQGKDSGKSERDEQIAAVNEILARNS